MTGSGLLRWNLLCEQRLFLKESVIETLQVGLFSDLLLCHLKFASLDWLHICSFSDRSFSFLGLLFGLKGHSVTLELDSCCLD